MMLAILQIMEREHYTICERQSMRPKSCFPQYTGKKGMPLFNDWKFHQGVFSGIGFHNKIIASQVIVDDANSTARSRSATASRQ